MVSQTNSQVNLTTFEGDHVLKSTEMVSGNVEGGNKEGSITVTWEKLRVTVPNGHKRKPILQGLTGIAQPGRLLAIMGPSGSGKSTLLDALAGRLSSNMKHTGNILINGHKQALAYGISGYVTQDEAMLSRLTARETLYYSAQLQFPDSMSITEKKEQADLILREMGLIEAVNTRVGGWGSKGLSGGQRRRLSICIEILTRPRLLFLDEPTSGLDSAASYYVMSGIARLNLRDGIQRTIVVSIHQPSSELFELFHDLCLLSSGEAVYFGPAYDANQFFAANGFPCPTLHNPSDHYLRIINKDFEMDVEEGFGKGVTTEEAIGILVKSYRSSQIRTQVKKKVEIISKSDSGAIGKKRIHGAFTTQCLVLIRRSSLQLFRDVGNYWLRLVVFVMIAISIGSIFYGIGSSSGSASIQGRGSLLTFLVSVLTFMTLVGGFSPLLEEMKVFERERLNGHYGVTAFLIGNIFSSLPYIIMISVIPGGIAYQLCKMHKGLEHFLYFISLLIAIVMWVESLMLVVGSISPNYVIGMFITGGIEGLMILTAGFYRLPNELPKLLWKYPLYHISFLKYAFQGSFKNEFEGLKVDVGTNIVSGREILNDKWHVEIGHSKWVDLAIMFGMIVLYRVLFLVITKSKEKLKPSGP
ncbi:white-brown-complex ABC transporter family protein [Medicago truncatula]|uniref:White-brown-complex ABC transporter family protein n=2 Tax=Medicago truncatula TaxID=3880 RepID=A0A072UPA8_MEDTR|nr:white-brown-complex ABC transporter family protein [Medicago truncatula]